MNNIFLNVKEMESLTQGIHSSSCCFDGKKSIYVFGGRKNYFDEIKNLYKYDIEKNNWIEIPILNDKWPSERCGHAMILRNGKIYLFGGMMENYDSNVWVFDVSTNSWEVINSNTPQFSFFGYYYDEEKDKIITHGGMCDYSTSYKIYEMNFDDMKWNMLKVDIIFENDFSSYPNNTPMKRMEHCISKISNDEFILFGGWSNKHESFNDIWKFNFINKVWSELHPLGIPHSSKLGHIGFIVKNKYFIICGGNQNSKEIKALDFINNKWINIEDQCNITLGNHSFCTYFNHKSKKYIFAAGGSCKVEISKNVFQSVEISKAYIFEEL